MARRGSKHPTDLELEILKALWALGPCSVKQIQERLAASRGLAYTTVVTMLTIMANKRFVRKRRLRNGYVYEALVPRDKASGNMLQDLIDRVFDGSTLAVVQSLLVTTDIDAEELTQIRRLINRKAKEQQ
jgi:BlaI family transcriptional regulator, penicillinase repressor